MLRISLPDIFGPGSWLIIHFLALICKTFYMKECFKVVVMIYIVNLTCSVCREHAREFIEKNPISEATDLVAWTIKFHNHANVKTGKKEITNKRAKELVLENLLNKDLVKRFGPGMWIFMSIICFYASTSYEKLCVVEIIQWFVEEINNLTNNYHLSEIFYEIETQLKKAALVEAKEYELFAWSVDFHNRVNLRLGKDQLSFEDALDMYQSVCEKGCAAH